MRGVGGAGANRTTPTRPGGCPLAMSCATLPPMEWPTIIYDDRDRWWITDSVSDARSPIEYSEATGGPVDLPHPRYHGDRIG